MDETPKNLWEDTDTNKYQYHVTIPTIDSTIESENVDERVVYIGDLEKRKQALQNDKYALKSLNNSSDICSDFLNEIKSHLQIYLVDVVQCFGITQDPNNKDSDTNYTIQSTSANPISECLDVQLSELELNEICQDGEDNIE
ncbi:kinase-like domain-containing protein [Rhizophagus irregularis DAOM 181602=DAOM 197198]|nr:kinase-like domain-containing protein [Rhizophagus irregularis DAOM 181602=DAOM 197198]